MSNLKYYTPSIEEVHHGFEYEFHYIVEGWKKETFGNIDFDYLENNIKEQLIRVKYLNKDDIESLGFVNTGNNSDGHEFQKIIADYSFYDINFSPEENLLIVEYFYQSARVAKVTGVMNSCIVFKGTIKNKSELTRLLKQLNIQ